MDPILVKIFATALALSEVMTQPQAVKTHFDPATDQAQVVQILRNGCAHMRQAFDIESINVDDLITTALDDPKAVGANAAVFHGINFSDLNTAYHQFCKNESIDKPVVDLGQVINFFDDAAASLPDATQLKDKKLPAMSEVRDAKGQNFTDVFQPGNRRIWVPLADVPDFVQKAFIAAEDQRFYQHHGIDERGIIRAFIGNLANPGRPEGGSTITQQVVKNLLVGEDVTYQRKIREMIVASRLEATLNKNDILQLYLNSAYLGRGSWGVEMASRSYFGKSAKDLTLGEGAMLAGLLKGPSFYNPDRNPGRAKDRLAYVLGRMKDDGYITADQKDQALAAPPKLVAFERPHRDSGFEFVDYLGREAKSDGVETGALQISRHRRRSEQRVHARLRFEARIQGEAQIGSELEVDAPRDESAQLLLVAIERLDRRPGALAAERHHQNRRQLRSGDMRTAGTVSGWRSSASSRTSPRARISATAWRISSPTRSSLWLALRGLEKERGIALSFGARAANGRDDASTGARLSPAATAGRPNINARLTSPPTSGRGPGGAAMVERLARPRSAAVRPTRRGGAASRSVRKRHRVRRISSTL